MKARSIDLSPKGLYVDGNPHSEVPQGALRQADDIIIRRPGVIEPRPGFATAISGWTPPGSTTAQTLVPFGSETLVIDSTPAARWLSDGDAVTGLTASPMGGHWGYAKARDRLFVCDLGGVLILDSNSDTSMRDAGLPKGRQGTASATTLAEESGGWAAASTWYAYRVLFRRDVSTTYAIRGAPSGRFQNRSRLLSIGYFTVTVSLPAGVASGDVIEVYRSVGSTTDPPSDDLYYATEHTLTSADITAGSVSIDDYTSDLRLGKSLYTNVGAEGIESSKYRPPQATDVALFQGSMFYANTVQDNVLSLRLANMAENGMGHRGWAWTTMTINTTNGSNTAAIASGDAALYLEGALITEWTPPGTLPSHPGEAGTNIDSETFITSVGGGVVTLSKDAIGTASGVSVIVSPWVRIDGEDFYAFHTTVKSPAITGYYGFECTPPKDGASPDPETQARINAESLCDVVNHARRGTGVVLSHVSSNAGGAEFLLESDRYEDSTVQVYALPGDAWTPTLDDVTVTSTKQDAMPHRLMWSATDEPEAVPLGNFVDVGEEGADIYRIIPTTDALWIVKEDGVFRLTGRGAAAGWTVDKRYATVRLLGPRACCVHDEMLWIWSEDGVVALGDTGSTVASGPIDATLRPYQDLLADGTPATVRAFLRSNQGDHEVVLGVEQARGNNYASELYVLNTKTQAWTRWAIDAFDVLEQETTGELLIAARDGTNYSVLIEGEAESFSPVIEWQARSERDPFVCKRWGRVDLGFDTMSGITAVTFAFTSDISTTPAGSGALSVSGLTRYTPIPSWVPRNHCMSTALYPKVTITQSTTPAWRLVGLSIQYEPASVRPRRVHV